MGGAEEQLLIPTGGRAFSFQVPWVVFTCLFGAKGSSSFAGNDLGREEQVGICSPSARSSRGKCTSAPSIRKAKKKRKIYDQWAVKYSQTVPPEASLPLNLPLPQFPMAWLFQTECATAPGPWWDKYCGHFPHLKWHFQG